MDYIIIFFLGMAAGLVSEYILTFCVELLTHKPLRIHHRFSFGKKVGLLMLPLWGILAIVIFRHNYSLVKLFAYSAVIGTIFEFATGYFFYRVFRAKVWTYKQGALGKFTSIYSIPYWGGGGLLFFAVAKAIGL